MSGAKSLSVSFKVTEEDVFQYMRDHGLYFWKVMLPVGVLYTVAAFGVLAVLQDVTAVSMTLLGGVMTTAAGVWWYRFYLRRVARRWYRELYQKTPGATEVWQLEITPEGLSCSAELCESRLKWAVYQQVRGTPTHIYFYRRLSPATLIPRRAFTTAEEAEVFLQAAAAWHAAAAAPPTELSAS